MTDDAPMSTATETRPCPRCGSVESTPIVYGYPTTEAFEAAERGEISLGGCAIGPESPELECRGCRTPLPWPAPDD